MSKRAEERALKEYPPSYSEVNRNARRIQSYKVDTHKPIRQIYIKAYEQAEKDTTDRAAKWIRAHWREYILGPDADGCIRFGLWENDFRKAMEEE